VIIAKRNRSHSSKVLSPSGASATLANTVAESPTQSVRRREGAIRLTVAASVGAKAFSVACTFVQVPIALHYLGTEAYGFWFTLFSIVIVINTLDFGLGVAMQHAMATGYGNDDLESIRRTFWTGTAVLGVLGAALLVIGLPIAVFGPWADVLRIHDQELRASVGKALSISLALLVAALPFNAVSRLAAAVQRGWIQAGWIAAGSAISLGMVAVAAAANWGFLWFLTLTLLVPVIQGTGLTIHLLRRLKWDFRPSRLAPPAEIRRMLRSSFTFSLPQFGQMLAWSLPPVAISAAAGSAAVTAYSLLIRLFSPFHQGLLILLAPIWPAYTEAHQRADHHWVSRTFWRTMVAFLLFAVGLVFVAWQSHRLLAIWVGAASSADASRYAAPVALWCILQMAAQPGIHSLMGLGKLRRLAWAATPGYVATVAALFWGARSETLEGVLSAGSVALGLGVLPALIWASVGAIRDLERGPVSA
jgi:O-antigen/teichoic acid export membrane protein